MRIKPAKLLSYLASQLQFRTDTTNFLFDKPKFDYQPLPWIGIHDAEIRGEATKERWVQMKNNMPENAKTIKDIGCCVGYFCTKANEELNMHSFGYDNNEKHIRLGSYAVPKQLKPLSNFLFLTVDQKTVNHLIPTDVTLCLSIWHHWFYDYGLEGATKILQTLWSKTNKTMFFESGEEEVKEEMNLPFIENMSAREWLKQYLEQVLPNSRVTSIGQFQAGNYAHYTKTVNRTVFKIEKI
jgi:hypothetical protein